MTDIRFDDLKSRMQAVLHRMREQGTLTREAQQQAGLVATFTGPIIAGHQVSDEFKAGAVRAFKRFSALAGDSTQ